MKWFILGIVAVILVLVLALVGVILGFVDMRADKAPSALETTIAGRAMDASVARAAPKVANPVPFDETNLTAGAHLYRDHCALCHGDPVNQKGELADSLNPAAPQFMTDMPDMPEHQNFYILQHGIRWTAMPGWKSILDERQIWQLVTFLSHMHDLPPTAKSVFTEPASTASPVTH